MTIIVVDQLGTNLFLLRNVTPHNSFSLQRLKQRAGTQPVMCIEINAARPLLHHLPPPCCVLEQDTLLPESTG